MRIFKSNRSTKSEQSLEKEIGRNIQNLTRSNATFRQPDNGNDELSANNLGALLRRVTEASTREIDSLIDQLHELHKQLESDGDRIQNYFARYEELNQGVSQLTTIISDNVKRLRPGAPGSGNETHSPGVMETASPSSPPLSPSEYESAELSITP